MIERLEGPEALPGLGWDPAYGAEPTTEATAKAPRVLVVDDEESVVKAMARTLRRFGYEVVGCGKPDEALEIFIAQPGRFDFVLTDYRMPGMTGVELCERIQSARPGQPVWIITAAPAEVGPDDIARSGVLGVLPKPLHPEQLRRSLGD